MSNKLENRVKAVIARYFNLPPSKVGLDAAFVGDLGGDPLDLIELGYQLEAAFNVRWANLPSEPQAVLRCISGPARRCARDNPLKCQ